MLTMKHILSTLPLMLSALAAPAPAPVIANATASDVIDLGLVDRAAAIDPNGQSRVVLCNDRNRGGQCLDWGQKSHCWDFSDSNLNPFNDAVSSIYPRDEGVVWVLHENYGCGGSSLQVVAPGIDNLADFNFNDKVSSFSWFLR